MHFFIYLYVFLRSVFMCLVLSLLYLFFIYCVFLSLRYLVLFVFVHLVCLYLSFFICLSVFLSCFLFCKHDCQDAQCLGSSVLALLRLKSETVVLFIDETPLHQLNMRAPLCVSVLRNETCGFIYSAPPAHPIHPTKSRASPTSSLISRTSAVQHSSMLPARQNQSQSYDHS